MAVLSKRREERDYEATSAYAEPFDLGREVEIPGLEDSDDGVREIELSKADVERLLIRVIDIFTEHSSAWRYKKLQEWKRAELYWEGIQRIWWSDVAHDWRYPELLRDEEIEELGMSLEDRNVNIYRAHGESIIAALARGSQGVIFFPDNAENPDDVQTAKTCSKIVDLIRRHNKFDLLYLRALFLLYNQDYIAAYNWARSDSDYGMRRKEIYEDAEVDVEHDRCPHCDMMVDGMASNQTNGSVVCPSCGIAGSPLKSIDKEKSRVLAGYEEEPKKRVSIEVYGGIHVDILPYIREQKQTPYLFLKSEHHIAEVVSAYPSLIGKIVPRSTSSNEFNEQEIRLPSMMSEVGEDIITVRQCWLRPSAFYALGAGLINEIAALRKLYPSGVKVVMPGDLVAEIRREKLDDHWTISSHPLSRYMHGSPIGKPLIPVQEMTSQLIELTLQTVEYGIPSEFADPNVVDFDAFNKTRSQPGMLYPAKSDLGRPIGDAFYSTSRATLSREIAEFAAELKFYGQFVVASFPSIFGGTSETGSKTAFEYSESRQNALQRLSTIDTMLSYWTADLMSRSVKSYIALVEESAEDERFVDRVNGNFVNIDIKQADLYGKVGRVEPEVSSSFPLSWEQKRAVLLELIGLNSEPIQAALFSPENAQITSQAIGLKDLIVPGEADRAKQWKEIYDIVRGQQVQGDEKIDNHIVHMAVIKAFLVSDSGLRLKERSPEIYDQLLAHYDWHDDIVRPQQGSEEGRV